MAETGTNFAKARLKANELVLCMGLTPIVRIAAANSSDIVKQVWVSQGRNVPSNGPES
jgi:hypothetical protein